MKRGETGCEPSAGYDDHTWVYDQLVRKDLCGRCGIFLDWFLLAQYLREKAGE